MKVSIVTIYDYFNHGNRLQNYALEKAIEKLGCEAETLALAPKKFMPFCFNLACAFPIMPVTLRLARSKKFTKQNLNSTDITKLSMNKLSEREIDTAIIGSDQVFNPKYIINYDKTFLKFVPSGKRVAFSASFGVSSLPENLKQTFKEGLSGLREISIRETQGAEIAKELTGKEVSVIADPTFLLTKQDWETFGDKAELKKKPKKKYIITYFLLPKKEYRQKVKQLSKKFGLKVININNFFDKYCSATPQEFIELLKGAEFVCTNSFHGHALSILLEKPFISFPSVKSTGSRIKTLLKITGLENRNYQILKDEEIFEIDYSKTREKIANEREKGIAFLKNALGLNKELS